MRQTMKLLALFLGLSLLVGCSGTNGASPSATRPEGGDKAISVVTTIFPLYDWAREVIGEQKDRVVLTLLQDKGTDLHNYQPTVEDIHRISTCDLFIYVGGESDQWVTDVLAQGGNPNRKVLCLLDALGSAAREETLLEGMQSHDHEHEDDHDHEHEDEHDHDHEDDHDHDHEDEHDQEHRDTEYDEHIWLSLRNAQVLCEKIQAALTEIDPSGAESYQKNCLAYVEALNRLDRAYVEAIAAASRKTLVFADRFPFCYLAEDYGLQCWAAFSGCSAEAEASFDTVHFLVNKVDELELPWVMKLESSDDRLAQTVISSTQAKNAGILELDSIQTVTAQQVAEGVSYLAIMEQNLQILKTALE